MKELKKGFSIVLAFSLIFSMFSMVEFSLIASADDSDTKIIYTEDFQNGITNWEVKNLLEGKISEPEGYAVKMNVVTPENTTKALQPLYYAYDSANETYSSAGSDALSGYNATAAIFKSDIVPEKFTKKTITGTIKTRVEKYSGSGGKINSNIPRLVIGEDTNGNPVSVALYKFEEQMAAILPVTYVDASNNKIYVTNDGSTVWDNVWSKRHSQINLKPGRTVNGGSWGPTVNYKIEISPNVSGTYDTTVTFTNTYGGDGADPSTAVATATVSGILSKVTSFGINVSAFAGSDQNKYGAYDDINIEYEIPSKAATNFITEWNEKFGDGSQYVLESQIDTFLEDYYSAKNELDDNIKNAVDDVKFLEKVQAVKETLSATVNFSTASSDDFENTKTNSIFLSSKSDYLTWTDDNTILSNHDADDWGLSSIVYHKRGTDIKPYYYYSQTLLNPRDVKNGTTYRNYADEVIAPPKSADFYYTYGIFGQTNFGTWHQGEWFGVNYAISPTVTSAVNTTITDNNENSIEITGTQYQTTLYMVEFRIAFTGTDSSSEPLLASRTFKRKITEIVYKEEDLINYGSYGLANSVSSLADKDYLYQGTQNVPTKETISSLLIAGSNDPYEDGALFDNIYKLLKVNLSYEDNDPSKPIFIIEGKYNVGTETGKTFTMQFKPNQTVDVGTERAFGYYVDGECKTATYGGFANPVVTYDLSKVNASQILKEGNSIIANLANDKLTINSLNADEVKANSNAALAAYNNADTSTKAAVDALAGIDVVAKLEYTVKYADVVKTVAKPSLLGTQLKKVTDTNSVDFRYAVEYVEDEAVTEYSVAGYGAVVVPNQVRADKTADITTSVKVTEGKEKYISNVYIKSEKVKVDKNNRYYVAVSGSKGKLGTLFDCRPYIIYKDSEGTEYFVYAENNIDSIDGTDVVNGQSSTCCLFVTKVFAQRIIEKLSEYDFTDMGDNYDTIEEMKTAINKIGQTGDNKPTGEDRAAYFKFIYRNNSAYEANKGV